MTPIEEPRRISPPNSVIKPPMPSVVPQSLKRRPRRCPESDLQLRRVSGIDIDHRRSKRVRNHTEHPAGCSMALGLGRSGPALGPAFPDWTLPVGEHQLSAVGLDERSFSAWPLRGGRRCYNQSDRPGLPPGPITLQEFQAPRVVPGRSVFSARGGSPPRPRSRQTRPKRSGPIRRARAAWFGSCRCSPPRRSGPDARPIVGFGGPRRGLRTSVRRDARRYRTSPALWPPTAARRDRGRSGRRPQGRTRSR